MMSAASIVNTRICVIGQQSITETKTNRSRKRKNKSKLKQSSHLSEKTNWKENSRSLNDFPLSSANQELIALANATNQLIDEELVSDNENKHNFSTIYNLCLNHVYNSNDKDKIWSENMCGYSSLSHYSANAPEKLLMLLSSYFALSDNENCFQVYHNIVNSLSYLLQELNNFPKNDLLFKTDPNCDDKVNAELRNEAIFNLRFLHKFYMNSSFVFAAAVDIVDSFISKVKVKPKYMACVATAAYYIALQRTDIVENCPTARELVHLARCGGSAKDLERMESIILNKIGNDEPNATSHMFLNAVSPLLSEEDYQNACTELERCLCFATVYQHRTASLMVSLLAKYLPSEFANNGMETFSADCNVHPIVYHIAEYCNLSWQEVSACSQHIKQLNAIAIDKRPASPKQLIWILSKRTMSQLHRPAIQQARIRKLPIICEDPQAWWEEQDDGLDLGRLFVD